MIVFAVLAALVTFHSELAGSALSCPKFLGGPSWTGVYSAASSMSGSLMETKLRIAVVGSWGEPLRRAQAQGAAMSRWEQLYARLTTPDARQE